MDLQSRPAFFNRHLFAHLGPFSTHNGRAEQSSRSGSRRWKIRLVPTWIIIVFFTLRNSNVFLGSVRGIHVEEEKEEETDTTPHHLRLKLSFSLYGAKNQNEIFSTHPEKGQGSWTSKDESTRLFLDKISALEKKRMGGAPNKWSLLNFSSDSILDMLLSANEELTSELWGTQQLCSFEGLKNEAEPTIVLFVFSTSFPWEKSYCLSYSLFLSLLLSSFEEVCSLSPCFLSRFLAVSSKRNKTFAFIRSLYCRVIPTWSSPPTWTNNEDIIRVVSTATDQAKLAVVVGTGPHEKGP